MDEAFILPDQHFSRAADRRDVFDPCARRQQDCWFCSRCIRAGTSSPQSPFSSAHKRIGNSSHRFRIAVPIRDLLSGFRQEHHELDTPQKRERSEMKSFLLLGLALVVVLPSSAKDHPALSMKVFTSLDDQFWVNSTIIEGAHEVMLVDAQLTKASAERVLQEIRETKKPLSIIYITHEHADHFLGLEVFREAYPRVRIIANSAVVERINKVYQEKIDKWKTILGPGATSHVVAIEQFDGDFITFGSSQIEVLKNIQGDTDENTMLWIPGQRILIAGDVW